MSHQKYLDKIMAGVAKLDPNRPVGIEIQRYRALDAKYAQVAVALSRNATIEEVAIAFADEVKGEARLVPGSIQLLANTQRPIVSFVVAKNVQSRPFDAKEFSEVARGVAIDSDSNPWLIEGEGDNRRVVRESADDIDAILEARKTRGAINTASTNLRAVPAEHGDFAKYIDLRTGQVKYGFVYQTTAGRVIGNPATGTLESFSNDAVLEAAPVTIRENGLRPFETRAALSGDRANEVLEYLKKAWHDNPDMLEKLKSMINTYGG